MFMTPILVTLLSIAVLGERVGIWRWAAIALGFAGAVVVVRPWDSLALSFGSGEVYLLMAALTNACYQIATRRLRFDHPMTSLLFTAVAGAAVTSIFLPYYWLTPDLTGWVLMIASGSAGCAGHLFLIRALSAAPASVVAPYAYSSLVWATMFGFLIWGTWPNSNTLMGAVLIVAAGLLIFLRERKHGTSQPPAVEG
jgi:drug/metabolite transporter (DMT)-like permease